MAEFYTYLISSLPMLHLGAKPPFSFEAFLDKCTDFIPARELEILRALKTQAKEPGPLVIQRYLGFETMLRNELVKIRASRKKIDAHKFLRPDSYVDPSVYHIALAAAKNHSPLEGERLLDEARWKFLDEQTFGHYFDLDILIIYAYKLLLLERWEKINTADREQLLEEVVPKEV